MSDGVAELKTEGWRDLTVHQILYRLVTMETAKIRSRLSKNPQPRSLYEKSNWVSSHSSKIAPHPVFPKQPVMSACVLH